MSDSGSTTSGAPSGGEVRRLVIGDVIPEHEVPDPICDHERKGRVWGRNGEAHASVSVCDRLACIDDAKQYVEHMVDCTAQQTWDVRYTEHEKMAEIKDQSQQLGAFLEWLRNDKNWVLAQWDDQRSELRYADQSIERLLATYFGIDLDLLETEKRHMLDRQRKFNEEMGLA